jgi:SPW repeat
MKPSSPTLMGRGQLNRAAGALMVWVALAPWILGFADSRPAVANHIFFILAFGPLALLIVILRPAAFAVLAAGLWLATSPWLLGYARNDSAWLSELVTGLLLTTVGGAAAGISGATLFRRSPRQRRRAAAPVAVETLSSRS